MDVMILRNKMGELGYLFWKEKSVSWLKLGGNIVERRKLAGLHNVTIKHTQEKWNKLRCWWGIWQRKSLQSNQTSWLTASKTTKSINNGIWALKQTSYLPAVWKNDGGCDTFTKTRQAFRDTKHNNRIITVVSTSICFSV